MVMCGNGTFINGAQVRYENYVGTNDDTTLNGLRITCGLPFVGGVFVKEVHAGFWGDWKP